MTTKADEALRALALDRTTATFLVSDDREVRHFIAESLVVAAGLFLLEHYAGGFLKGLGFEAIAEQHGSKAKDLLKKIKSSVSAGSELIELRLDTEGAIDEVRKHDSGNSAAAQRLGEASVIAVLVEEGVPTAKAAEIAARAAIAVRGDV
jgi:hypothetical protein